MIPEGYAEFASDLKRFLELVKRAYRNNTNILDILNEVDKGENSDKFIAILSRYLEFSIQPAKETAFLRELAIDQFNNIVEYCCLHCIISNDPIQVDDIWKEE